MTNPANEYTLLFFTDNKSYRIFVGKYGAAPLFWHTSGDLPTTETDTNRTLNSLQEFININFGKEDIFYDKLNKISGRDKLFDRIKNSIIKT